MLKIFFQLFGENFDLLKAFARHFQNYIIIKFGEIIRVIFLSRLFAGFLEFFFSQIIQFKVEEFLDVSRAEGGNPDQPYHGPALEILRVSRGPDPKHGGPRRGCRDR